MAKPAVQPPRSRGPQAPHLGAISETRDALVDRRPTMPPLPPAPPVTELSQAQSPDASWRLDRHRLGPDDISSPLYALGENATSALPAPPDPRPGAGVPPFGSRPAPRSDPAEARSLRQPVAPVIRAPVRRRSLSPSGGR